MTYYYDVAYRFGRSQAAFIKAVESGDPLAAVASYGRFFKMSLVLGLNPIAQFRICREIFTHGLAKMFETGMRGTLDGIIDGAR